MLRRYRQLEAPACGQARIQDLHRRKRRRSAHAGIFPGDDSHRASSTRQADLAHAVGSQRLVARCRHLVSARQVDPKLRHLERPALLRERLGVILLVRDAGAGRHPLHVAGPIRPPAPVLS